MGVIYVNGEFIAHGNPTGGEKQRLRLHLGDTYDNTVVVPLATWDDLRAAVRANNRSQFDTKLGTITVPGGWDADKKDALWTAGVRNWADGSSVE